MTSKSEAKFECKYCNKKYVRESTLAVHQCEPSRRWKQENEVGVRLGFNAWLRFYHLTQSSKKQKTYGDFVKSSYYSAFVRFGWYLHQIRAIQIQLFTDSLIKENVKLDWWTKERYYDKFLYGYLRKEHPNAALERGMKEIVRWSEDSGHKYENFFTKAGAGTICNMIANGRISPWVVFNCAKGVQFLATLNSEQTTMVYQFIDPDYWQRRFVDYYADTEFAKEVLEAAGLN